MTTIPRAKLPFVLCLIFFSVPLAFGQTIDTVQVVGDSLEKKAVELDMKWHYHPGDSAVWASPEYDFSTWDTINAVLPIREMPDSLWGGIGWFKKIFRIDSSLMNNNIALLISQTGASEIFLNGKSIHKFGKVSTIPDSEVIYQPNYVPLVIKLDDAQTYALSIRYSNLRSAVKRSWYKRWYSEAGFHARLAPVQKSVRNKVVSEALTMVINIGIACIFISLSLLYLILFIFYSRRKENLYYFIFTFFISIVFSSNMIPRFFPSDFFQRTFWAIMNGLSVFFIFWSYLGFLYSIFYKKMPRLFWIATAVLLPVIALIFVNVNDKTIEFIFMSYIVLATLEGLRIIIMAIRRGEENAWVIGAGVIVFVCFIAFLFVIGIIDSQVDISILLTIFMIGLLCIPISMSVYLARTIASTNENLIQQLETVKELSQKELEHQKQQAEYERRMKELEEARQLQLSMLPKVIPQLPNLDIAVHMQTATEVGGDYYDFEKTADGMLTIVVGDATGHGMKAGTVVTASKSLFNALAEKEDIPATLREMARSIKRMEFHLLSMCMMMIKTDGKTLRLSSAGMPPALLYRADTGVVEELLTKGMPLGTFPEFDYQLRETNLAKGDTILLMSDGMPELFNQKKEMFGYDRISSLFKSVAGETVQKIIDRLVQAGREWIEGEDPQDDITFLAFKVK